MFTRSVTPLTLVAILCTAMANAQTGTSSADLPLQQIASSNPDKDWRPSAEQRLAVERISREYFALKDSGKLEQAYALISPRQKQYLTQSSFISMGKAFNEKAGAPQGRNLTKVTWYKDTPQAGPGLYVAVDYSSKFDKLALHCGYVVWQEQPDGGFLQVREESNMIENDIVPKLKPGQLETIRAQYRC